MITDGGGGGGLASGLGGGALAGSMTESVDLATERNTILHDIRDYTERMAMSSGDGGGGGLIDTLLPVGFFSALQGGLGGLLGKTSLGALVTKVSLKSLLTRIPAFATLVTAADLGKDLVTGKLTKDDLVSAPIELGNLVTFGQLNSKAVEGAIGSVTLAVGTYQIGSIVAGKLSGSALGSYFGTTSMSGMLSEVGGGSALSGLLGSVGIGAILTGLGAGALAGLLGTVAISEVLSGGKVDFSLGPTETTTVDSNTAGTSTPVGPTAEEVLETVNSESGGGDDELSHAELQQQAMENQTWSMNASVGNSDSSSNTSTSNSTSSNNSSDSTSSTQSSQETRQNRASEKSRQQPEVNYSPTFNVDLSKLERKFDRDLRKLQQQVDQLEKQLDSISNGGVR